MNSDGKVVAVVISFWAIIILSIIVSAFIGIRYAYVKTSNAIVSYKAKAPEREEASKKITKERRKSSEERKVARAKKKEKAKARKRAKIIAAFDDPEFGTLMHNPDGTLRDPDTDDAYTPRQGYLLLAILIVWVFGVWAGTGTGTWIGFIIAWAFCIISSLIVLFVW